MEGDVTVLKLHAIGGEKMKGGRLSGLHHLLPSLTSPLSSPSFLTGWTGFAPTVGKRATIRSHLSEDGTDSAGGSGVGGGRGLPALPPASFGGGCDTSSAFGGGCDSSNGSLSGSALALTTQLQPDNCTYEAAAADSKSLVGVGAGVGFAVPEGVEEDSGGEEFASGEIYEASTLQARVRVRVSGTG